MCPARSGWLRGLAAFLAAVALSFPAAAAESAKPYRIGVLNEASAANHPTVEGLKAGLRELGLQEGRDVTFDIRFTKGNPKAMPAEAEALVKAGVDLIFTSKEIATLAAKAATQKLPIVFTLVGDPITAGVVTQFVRPGGNVTGISSLTPELMPKRLEVLKTLFPAVKRVWYIHDATDPTGSAALEQFMEAQGAAWGARRDVIDRATFNLSQSMEVIIDSCQPQGPVEVAATFDEFNLDLRVSYVGPPLELPDKRPSNEEMMESEDGQRRLAGFMLRRHADRVHATHNAGRSTILFHFDH